MCLTNLKEKIFCRTHSRAEIKYDTNLDIYVRNNLNQISSRLSKNSKFVNSATINAFSYM